MGLFEADNLTIRTEVLDVQGLGRILKITFNGVHFHHWPRPGMGWDIQDFLQGEARAASPAACLFDFLGYHYEFGDEMGGPVLAACIDTERHLFRSLAIVAVGITAERLGSLFSFANTDQVAKYGIFDSIEAGIDHLRKVMAQNEP